MVNKYICEKCNKEFANSNGLKTHMNRKNPCDTNKKFECVLCNRNFSSKYYLNKHCKDCVGPDEIDNYDDEYADLILPIFELTGGIPICNQINTPNDNKKEDVNDIDNIDDVNKLKQMIKEKDTIIADLEQQLKELIENQKTNNVVNTSYNETINNTVINNYNIIMDNCNIFKAKDILTDKKNDKERFLRIMNEAFEKIHGNKIHEN